MIEPLTPFIFALLDKPKEIPTLLHFAAFYNLTKLAKTLLKCPGAEEASRVTNCHGNVPYALADFREHSELARILRDNAVSENCIIIPHFAPMSTKQWLQVEVANEIVMH